MRRRVLFGLWGGWDRLRRRKIKNKEAREGRGDIEGEGGLVEKEEKEKQEKKAAEETAREEKKMLVFALG